jgi:hypothetical protein
VLKVHGYPFALGQGFHLVNREGGVAGRTLEPGVTGQGRHDQPQAQLLVKGYRPGHIQGRYGDLVEIHPPEFPEKYQQVSIAILPE